MSVGLLIVTHNRIGQELLDTAETILGACPIATAHLSLSRDGNPGAMSDRGLKLMEQLDQGQGVLILTDAFGATPSNVAIRLSEYRDTAVVSGVNLPMLLRVLNYPEHSLTALRDKAYSGGHDGILLMDPAITQQTRHHD